MEMARCLVDLRMLDEGCMAAGIVRCLPRSVSTKLLDDCSVLADLLERDHGRPVPSLDISQGDWLFKAQEFVLNFAD